MRNEILWLGLILVLTSCGASNSIEANLNNTTSNAASQILQLTEVDPVNNLVEIYNNTGSTINLTNYWLCSRINYERIGTSTIVSGNLNLLTNERIVIQTNALNLDNSSADLGLYETNTFGNPDSMVDFLQWGASGLGRESVAVAKGIWTTGDFITVPTDPNRSLTKISSGNSSADWTSALKTFAGDNAQASSLGFAVGGGELVISEVDPINNIIEIYNGTGATIDLSTYWFCSRITYENLSSSELISGSLNIADRGYTILRTTGIDLNDTAADLGLYLNNFFANPASMVDFVQWGAGNQGRESVAVARGIWTSGNFLTTPTSQQSIARNASGGGITNWSLMSPSLGSSANRN